MCLLNDFEYRRSNYLVAIMFNKPFSIIIADLIMTLYNRNDLRVVRNPALINKGFIYITKYQNQL